MEKTQKTKPTKKEYLQFLLEEYRNNNQKIVELQRRQSYLNEKINKLKDELQIKENEDNLTSDKGKNYNKDS